MSSKRLSQSAFLVMLVLSVTAFWGRPVLAEEPTTDTPAESNVAPKIKDPNSLVFADFDTGDKPNNIGGDFGGWDKDPNDETQGTKMSFEPNDALGDPAGYCIRLDYDVDSPNPAYNGFWMKLNGEDVSQYNTLKFYLKGDAKAGYTKRIKLELKDMSNKPSPYILSGITDEWKQYSIPLEKFRRITDWKSMNEFVMVFDDISSNPKTGTVYVDQITFAKD